jgi:Uma2 family endonuclease
MSKGGAVASWETIKELLEQLGGISPDRVRMDPLPGTATEEDLIRLNSRTDRLYELVDGTLVEKAMGYAEGFLAADLIALLRPMMDKNNLADVGGDGSTMRLLSKLVRIPDVAVIRWDRYPNGERPTEPVPELAPDLAVEVLSESNTAGEMQRKLKEYFLADVSLVWFVDPRKRTVEVFTAPDESTVFTEDDVLDGGDVLPGLSLPVRDVFARTPRAKPTGPRKRRRKKT